MEKANKNELLWFIADGFRIVKTLARNSEGLREEELPPVFLPEYGITVALGGSVFRDKEMAVAARQAKLDLEIKQAKDRVLALEYLAMKRHHD